MKGLTSTNKKIIPTPNDKKQPFMQNPYNDLPANSLIGVKASTPKIAKLRQKNIEMSKSPNIKIHKMVSPDVVKVVGLSPNSNNDSMHKLKNMADDSKKNKKVVKLQKYNDYFDLDNPDPKTTKLLVNLSKKSNDSNASAKSIQSETKKIFPSSKQVNKNNQKAGVLKQFPMAIKGGQGSPHPHTKLQDPETNTLLNKMPSLKPKQVDDRKSWSYSNLNAHSKTNSKELDINKNPFFAGVDLKNTRNTTGNHENSKSIGLQAKSTDSTEKITKSNSFKGKFIPSSSKSQSSQSPDKLKKHNQLVKLGCNSLHTKMIKDGTGEHKVNVFQNNACKFQQNLYSYPKILQIGQSLSLRVVSWDAKIKTASFKVLKVLSQDKKTSLYLVVEQNTGFLYCLKKCEVMTKEKDEDYVLNSIKYLIREGKIGAYLNHPGIIKTYCTLYDGLHVYQLLQFIEGNNLYDRNKDQFCSQRSHSTTQRDSLGVQSSLSKFVNKMYTIKQILYQLLEALAYLHQRGIVHRDIKPANILITHDNCYKIGDFGTAIWEYSAQPIGTLDYAAPEVMLKEKYDCSVDIWAVGCIGFQLYVGYPPFFNENREITIKRITSCDYQQMMLQDEGLSSLITKMLQKRPQRRISAKQALKHPFLSQFQLIKDEI